MNMKAFGIFVIWCITVILVLAIDTFAVAHGYDSYWIRLLITIPLLAMHWASSHTYHIYLQKKKIEVAENVR
jgi:hypothetical protein